VPGPIPFKTGGYSIVMKNILRRKMKSKILSFILKTYKMTKSNMLFHELTVISYGEVKTILSKNSKLFEIMRI